MPLSDTLIEHLLPPDLPEGFAVSDAVETRLATLDDPDPEGPFQRALIWQDLMTQVVGENADRIADRLTSRGFDGLNFEMAVGFVPLAAVDFLDEKVNRARKDTDYVLGGVLYELSGAGDLDRIMMTSMNLGEIDPRLDGMPMLRKPAGLVHHAPPDLSNATTTAWATYAGRGFPDFILTAAHAVNWQNSGQNVTLSTGHQVGVVDCAPFPIDGLLLDAGIMSKGPVTPLPVEPMPVFGEPFEFVGITSAKGIRGHLTTIHVLPGVTSPMYPARIGLDIAGKPGDSGALVRSRKSGKAMALYSGVIETPQIDYPISQGLEQVRTHFNVDLWE